MLKPEYFNGKEAKMLDIYQDIIDYLYDDIAQRLLANEKVSGTADREILKLRMFGKRQEEILQRLSKMTGYTTKEIKRLLQDAVLTSWKDDKEILDKLDLYSGNPLENPVFMKVIDAEYRKGAKELENITRTTMNQTNKDLINMMDKVSVMVDSGLISYDSAVCKVLDEYAGRGTVIQYANRQLSVESAVRMCVVTSMNQTSAQLTNAYIKEGKCDYVLVSAHYGARHTEGASHIANHDEWQGQVYKIHGSDEHAKNLLEQTGYTIDDDGNGKVVNPLGLHGYNCRHSHQPWDISLKNPWIDDKGNLKIDMEQSQKLYDLQQQQRSLERNIRKTKRKINMKQSQLSCIHDEELRKQLGSELKNMNNSLKLQNENYKKFCENNNLSLQYTRTRISK